MICNNFVKFNQCPGIKLPSDLMAAYSGYDDGQLTACGTQCSCNMRRYAVISRKKETRSEWSINHGIEKSDCKRNDVR